jgi:hypothetical protein
VVVVAGVALRLSGEFFFSSAYCLSLADMSHFGRCSGSDIKGSFFNPEME